MRKTLIVLTLPFLFASPAYAAVLRVPQDFKTINGAVDAASPGDEVVIDEGIYNENIVIRKPIAVRSKKGPGSSVVRAAIKGEPSIKIADVSGVTLSGLTASGSTASGIILTNANSNIIKDNHSVNNFYGITLYNSRGNTLSGNVANSNENYGIYLERASNNTIENNTSNMNKDKGFFISYSNSNRVIGNSANMNTWNGMTVWSSHNNVFKDNMTLRNTYGIVLSDSDDNELIDNTTLPNVFIILPIVLIYLGVITYLIQKNLLRFVLGVR